MSEWCIYPANLSIGMMTDSVLQVCDGKLSLSHHQLFLYIYKQPYTQLIGYYVELVN